MAKRTRNQVDWQFGEDVWHEPESQAAAARRPLRFPWYLLALASMVACLLYWLSVPPQVTPEATPLPAAERATPVPATSIPSAGPTEVPRATPHPRIYMTNLSTQGNRGIVVYDPLTGSILRKLASADWPQIAVSPDGSTLFVADLLPAGDNSRAGRLRIFDTQTWELRVLTSLDDRIYLPRNFGPPALSVSANGDSLFVQRQISDTFRIDRVDARSGLADDAPAAGPSHLAALEPCMEARYVFPSADDRWLYESCMGGKLYFNDRVRHSITHGILLFDLVDKPYTILAGAAMSADSNSLYAVTPNGLVAQVDLQAGRVVTRVQLPLVTSQIVVSYHVVASGTPATLILGLRRGQQVESGLADEIWFVNTQTWQVQNQWVTQMPFASLAVSPDEQWLVTSNPVQETLTVYNLTTGEAMRTIPDTGISWSPVIVAPGPPEQSAPAISVEPTGAPLNERLYVLDGGDASTPPSLLGVDPRSSRTQRYDLPDARPGHAPDIAMSRDGSRIWVLQESVTPAVNRLAVLDALSGGLLTSTTVDDALPPAPAGGSPPRILAGLHDNLILQRAADGRFPVWLNNYLLGAAGIRRQVEPPYWFSIPLCGPSQMLWRVQTQRLLVVCQPPDGAPELSEAQVVLFGSRNVRRLTLADTPAAGTAALSPDESVLYVLGKGPTVTPVNLNAFTSTVAIYPIYLETFNTPGQPVGKPVVSQDGRTLYSALAYATNRAGAAALGTLWAMDTETWIVKARLALAQVVAGQTVAVSVIDLGLSYDGRWLYGLDALTGRILVVDTSRNVIVRELETGVANPLYLLVAPPPA